MIYLFESELWIWDARKSDSWTFASLPEDASDEIRDLTGDLPRGFGAVRVQVALGGSTWRTSIFPDSKSGVYVLPLKRSVRKAEGVEAGDTVAIRIELDGV